MLKRLCVWLLFIFSLSMIAINCSMMRTDVPIAESHSLVRILTIENEYNYPFYHTALELSYPGFNQTYGFYSTYSGWRFYLYGWMGHQGVVKSPDIFTVGSGSKKIPAGNLKSPLISIYLNRNQTLTLQTRLENSLNNPGLYSYINRKNVDNCASWVEYIINPILKGERLDCSLNDQVSLSVPGACHLNFY